MASVPARLRLIPSEASEAAEVRPPDAGAGLSDSQLVGLALDGDPSAHEALYRRHAGAMLNLAVRLHGHGVDVEDVVHDAFVKAFARLGELRERSAFRSWLGAIVVRVVRSNLRRRRLLGVFGLSAEANPIDIDAIASSDAGPEARAELAQVYALLCTLPGADRIAWTLRYVEHHRLEAVAELCGCSLATAKRRISRVQVFLNEHFVSTEKEP
jgi:RNA polymerase sigma-70 factor, ECF subfamily